MKPHMPSSLRMRLRGTAIARWYAQSHQRLYRWTGGVLGGKVWLPTGRKPLLLLTTTGRKSGEPRTTPLLYLRDANRHIVVASNGGHPSHPAWWLNLTADPHAQLHVGRRRCDATAHEVTGPERDQLWSRLVELNPDFVPYAEDTERTLPVVALDPTT